MEVLIRKDNRFISNHLATSIEEQAHVAQKKLEKEMEIIKRRKAEEELLSMKQQVEELKAPTKCQAVEIKKFEVEMKKKDGKVQTLEKKGILFQDKIYDAVKLATESRLENVSRRNLFLNIDTVNMITEQQHVLAYVSENNTFLNHEADDLIKYNNNYYERKERTE